MRETDDTFKMLLGPAPSDSTAGSSPGPDRAGEPVTVTGAGQKRKLMFARESGELHFVTLEESYGERTASLSVEPTANEADGAPWHLALNRKPFLAFTNRADAMLAYEAARTILNDGCAADAPSTFESRHHALPARDAAKDRSEWLQTLRIVGSVVVLVVLVVLGVFAGSIALRVANHVVPWKDDQSTPKPVASSPIATGRIGGPSQ